MKKKYIISCEVFRPEIEFLISQKSNEYCIVYLEQGLHYYPDKLRAETQEAVNKMEEEFAPDEILMGFGFCGTGLETVTAEKALLIFPKTHDCIPLILGTGPDGERRDSRFAETVWLSAGWIDYATCRYIRDKEERYQEYLEKYDEDTADYLIGVEFDFTKMYKNVTFVKWDEIFKEELITGNKGAQDIANICELPLEIITGESWYLKEFVEGGVDTNKFFHVKAGDYLHLNNEGILSVKQI